MRTEIQKEFLIEHGMDPNAEGQLIDNLFKYPKYISWKKRRLNAKEENQRMQEENNNEETNDPMRTAPQPEAPVERPGTNVSPEAPAAPVEGKPVINNTDGTREYPKQEPGIEVRQKTGFDKLDTSGEIEKQEFDPTPYIGKNSNIEFIEERHGQFGYYIKLLSEVIDDGDLQIRASAIYGLMEDKDGKLGWPPESKLYNYLKKLGVLHYRDLLEDPKIETLKDDKGEQFRRISGRLKTAIIIQTRDAKDGKSYLTF